MFIFRHDHIHRCNGISNFFQNISAWSIYELYECVDILSSMLITKQIKDKEKMKKRKDLLVRLSSGLIQVRHKITKQNLVVVMFTLSVIN